MSPLDEPTPQVLLFDRDGVLADVSRSFREAIVRTAAGYGVTITRGDVSSDFRRGSRWGWSPAARASTRCVSWRSRGSRTCSGPS